LTIEYKMVWVDDSPNWVDSVIGEIEEHIVRIGFKPNIKRLESGKEFPESCSSVDLDLIVVDYNLPNGKNGDELISELRASGVFKEIVFYSQQRPPKEVIDVTDGVFHAIRNDAVHTIKKVIDLTVHKLRDLGVVRGLVIASTIDIEVKLEELMILIFGKQGELFQSKVIEKHVYDFEKKVKFVQSYFKDVVSKASSEKKGELEGLSKKLATFAKEIIDQRNILAHAKTTVVDGNTTLQGINNRTREIVFDEQWLSDTRRKLREHMGNLLKIEAVLRKAVKLKQ